MANKNYQIAKFYASMHELKDKLNGEILPLAVHIGANQEDPSLFESLEILVTDIEQHLENYKLTVSEADESEIKKTKSQKANRL